MKVHLMSPVRDFDAERLPDPLPPQTADLVQDLELDVLFDAMGNGDAFIRKVVRAAILNPPSDPADARHRLEVLSYLAERPEVAHALYEIAGRALTRPRSLWLVSNGRPEASLRRSTVLLGQMCDALDELRRLVENVFGGLGSAGLRNLAETVRTQLPEEYMAELRAVLEVLGRRNGVLMNAGLGDDGTVAGMVPRVIGQVGRFGRLLHHAGIAGKTYTWTLPDRDEAGAQAVQALCDRSLWRTAQAAEHATSHVQGFFTALRQESAFFLDCLTLRERLAELRSAVCLPLLARDPDVFEARGLHDPGLALRTGAPIVENDLGTRRSRLTVVTGANHGGKTTILRAAGIAQMLADAGCFAPAEKLAVSPATRVCTHWPRQEEAGMRHGKLDEELDRMSRIVDGLSAGALLLSNESFSSTDEAEGSQIGAEVFGALADSGVRVMAVTHMYDLAETLRRKAPDAVFLRAERGRDGERPYRIVPGEPLPTAYASDFYRREFGADLPASGASEAADDADLNVAGSSAPTIPGPDASGPGIAEPHPERLLT